MTGENDPRGAQSVIQYSGPLSKTPQDFLNFVNFRHVHDISETFHMAGTKLGIFSFNLRY
jgi:hypothetical protein